MQAFLKNLGLPPMLLALIVTLATMVPTLFTLDARYAKDVEINTKLAKLDHDLSVVTIETANISGTQQVLLALISSQSRENVSSLVKTPPPFKLHSYPKSSIVKDLPIQTVIIQPPSEIPEKVAEIKKQIIETQRNLSNIQDRKF